MWLSIWRGLRHRAMALSAPSARPPPVTSAVDPDLGAVSKFITDMIAKGAIAALVAAIVALLVRMRDLNVELMRKLASKSRKRPPNEAMRRLQVELPFLCAPAVNDAKPAPATGKKPNKRGAKKPTPQGRPRLPAHLPRLPTVLPVAAPERPSPRSAAAAAPTPTKP